MINKKGTLVLRDAVFMILIISSIFIFAGLFVSETASNYANTNMTNEWEDTSINVLGNSTFVDTSADIEDTGGKIQVGIWSLVNELLKSIGNVVEMVITAPGTIAYLAYSTLIGMGVGEGISSTIYYLIYGLIWVIVIFTVASAFTPGGSKL